MNGFKRNASYIVGVGALFTLLVLGTEHVKRISDTGKWFLKAQREVYKQRDLYKKLEDSERAKYINSWYQLTAEPGYADNNPRDGVVSLGEKRELWEKAGRYDPKKGNPVAGMDLFPDGTQVFPPLTSENLETAIVEYKKAGKDNSK